jgi:endonuclease/exonuclease/phosphatase family metal-dependent hydrolase
MQPVFAFFVGVCLSILQGCEIIVEDDTRGNATAPAPTPLPPTSNIKTQIKFVEWNVHWENRNTEGMADTMVGHNADILGLCEFQANFDNLLRTLNQRSSGRAYQLQPGRDIGHYGTDIVFDSNKFEAVEGGKESVSCQGTCNGARAANWVVLKERATQRLLITGGIHLSACNNHNCQECELKKFYQAVERIRRKYPSAVVVWMGDMNRSPEHMKRFLDGEVGGMRVFQAEDMARANPPTHIHGSSTIDFVFVERGHFRRVAGGKANYPHGQWIGGQGKGSAGDHYPIYATIEWA